LIEFVLQEAMHIVAAIFLFHHHQRRVFGSLSAFTPFG
jgi:hypothetical protein